MRTPRYCGSEEFYKALNDAREKIDSVLESFDSGGFIEVDLKNVIMTTRHAAHVCRELIEWQHLKMSVKSAIQTDESGAFGWVPCRF